MKDLKDKQIVQRVIDNSLSGIQDDPWMAQHVLNQAHAKQGTGGIVVKKKLSVGFVLMMVVMLSTAVAIAWSLSNQYFEDVAQIQSTSGYYDDWGLDEKQKLVDTMLEYGLITETEVASLSDEEAVDAFMIDRYGIDGRSDTIGLWAILEKEKGALADWSLEDKAWYTKMQMKAALQTGESDEENYSVPASDDIQPEEAISMAKAAVIKAFGLEDNALDQHKVEISFLSDPADEYQDTYYAISFWGNGYEDRYFCYVTHDGQIMDSNMSDLHHSPAEQAKEKQQFMLENDLEVSELFTQYAQEHITGDYYFPFWPLEDKKSVTDMLRPIILANMAENPDYADQTNIYWATHFYGLPDESAISQEKAIEIAKRQLTTTFGLSDKQAAMFGKVGLFYEVTDPANPQWKITMRLNNGTGTEAAAIGLDVGSNYRVVINAYSGEVMENHYFTEVNANNPEDVAMSN